AARSGGTGAWSMSVIRASGRAPPPATSSVPAASSSRASRDPRNPAPPVITTFTTAPSASCLQWIMGVTGRGSGGARDGLLDAGLDAGRAFQVRHVAGAVDHAAGGAGYRLGLRRRDDPVPGAPDHGDRHRAAEPGERRGRVPALRVAVQQRAEQ